MAEKRLTKSKDKKIFGVCGGVAEYFGIDATAIRLIWALSILLWGTGLWLYILLAIIMPEPGTTTDAPKNAPDDGDDIVVEVADAPREEDEKK